MSKDKEFVDGEGAIDVEARVISVETEGQPGAEAVVTQVPQVSLVPALVVAAEVAKINPAIVLAKQLVERVEEALPTLDCSTKEGEERARALRKECVSARTGTESAYKAWNAPLLDAQRKIRDVVAKVKEVVTPAEEKLDALIKARELAVEAEKQRKIAEEQARMAALREKIAQIPAILPAAVSMTSAQVETELLRLQEMVITDDDTSFGEFSDEAAALRASTVSKLLEMFNAKKAAEDERVRLDEERRQQQERERAAEIERGLRQRIAGLQQLAFSAMGKSAAQIKTILDELIAKEPLALEFGDLAKEAASTWGMAKVMLENAYAGQKRIEDQQAEQERVAREQAAERQRLADEAAAAERARMKAEAEVAKPQQPDVESDEFTGTMPVSEQSDKALDAALASVTSEQLSCITQEIGDAILELASGAECTKDVTVEEPVIDAELYEPTFEFPQADGSFDTNGVLHRTPAVEREFTMSQYASRADLEEARALYVAASLTDMRTAGEVADQIIDALGFADFPTETAGELCIVSLLLHPEIQAALRARQEALIDFVESNA